ncbi:helix-turn-helix transcriptional regulator [Rhizobium leguminosarum]|uniref:helix-turn-helix domain-containing protein n=1 Tax=Rhizobium leguminosarum TaxID=384 RepID=UPI001C93E2C6|nr:helix-turn-helix transcriptional regulator [Rhizobium leguminosarum]MBY5819860.1 helix-turn-helix transcriptional regulator [Rhizobium leguminosarum]
MAVLSMDREFFVAERKRLKLTQEKMAEVLFLNVYTIKKWEGGDRKIPPYMGYVLAALEAGLPPRGKEYVKTTGFKKVPPVNEEDLYPDDEQEVRFAKEDEN